MSLDHLACGDNVTGSTADAYHWRSGGDAPDRFYLVEPNATQVYHLSLCGSGFDTVLAVYRVSANAYNPCLASPAPYAGRGELVARWDDVGAGNCAGGRGDVEDVQVCLLYTSPSPRDQRGSRMPSSA